MKFNTLRHIILIFNLIFCIYITGQDFHYSLIQFSPLNLNPAQTGWHDADIRINANHRTQWNSVTTPYNTYSFGSDFSKITPFPIGLIVNQDRAGDSDFNTFQTNLSTAFQLINDSVQHLRIGIQGGITIRSIQTDNLTFDSQYNGMFFDPTLPTNESFSTFNKIYGNMNFGIMYVRRIGIRNILNMDLSAFNLNQSDQSFMGAVPPVRIDPKITARIEHQFTLNDFFSIDNSIFFIQQGTHREVLLGAKIKYLLADLIDLKRAIWTGVYYRNKDAIFITGGFEFNQWQAGISYDINLSTLIPASRLRGGFEMALIYKIKRKIQLENPLLICLDYL